MFLSGVLRRSHKIRPKTPPEVPLTLLHRERIEKKGPIVLDDLDVVTQLSPQVSFNGRQLWSFSRLIRENRNYRRSEGACVVGGAAAIRRVWREYKKRPNVVYVPNTEPNVPSWCLDEELPTCIVRCSPVEINRSLLSAEYGDGCAAEFPAPVQAPLEFFMGESKSTRLSSMLVLVGLRIPSNIGVLIRAAVDMGFESILLEDCSDLLHEKVLRASEGAAFSPRVKIFESNGSLSGSTITTLSSIAVEHRLVPLLAVPSQRAESAFTVAKRFHLSNAATKGDGFGRNDGKDENKYTHHGPLLVLGSESQGLQSLSGEWPVAHQFVSLPLPNATIDSINVSVAGSILMHLFRPGGEKHFTALNRRHLLKAGRDDAPHKAMLDP